MKKLLLLCIACLYLNATVSNTQDLTLAFATSGTQTTKQMFKNNLQSISFWQKFLKDKFVDYGFYQNPKTLILTSKDSKSLYLVKASSNTIDLKKNFDIIIGKAGEKAKEGDLATPVGVYNLNKRFVAKDTFYGPLSYETNYPNMYDKLHKQTTGYGIWIHGHPLDGSKRDPMSKGCIVLQNKDLKNLDTNIKNLESTQLIIYEQGMPRVDKNDIALILANLYSWKYAWEENDLDTYLKFYDKDFIRNNGKHFKWFKNYKKMIFDKQEKKNIKFSDISIVPYPNLENHKLFKLTFHEKYRSESFKFDGKKELYIKINQTMKILVEQ